MNAIAILPILLFQLISSHSSTPVSQAGGLSWTPLASWKTAPASSSLRVVTYRIPAASGDTEGGELAVFYFGQGQGGSVESNVNRWFSQFQPEGKGPAPNKSQKTKIAALDVTLVSTEGVYASGMPGGNMTPKPGWALLGAIAEGPQGPVFFKLVGPKKTVAAAGKDFDQFLKGLKKTG